MGEKRRNLKRAECGKTTRERMGFKSGYCLKMVTGYLPVVVLFLSVELPFLALQVLLGKKMLISIFVYLISMMQIFKIQTHPTFSN